MVAGGEGLSSVVTLLPGAEAWTPLSSLPRALSNARASIVGDRIRLTGGFDDDEGYASKEVMSFHS